MGQNDPIDVAPPGRDQTPHTLFFSYSRYDLPIVQEIYLQLSREPGVSIWFDQDDIRPSRQWQAEIKAGLDRCTAVVLFASRFSIASANVKDEWLYALHTLGKPVHVWLLDNCELDPQLSACPTLDLRKDPFDRAAWQAGLHAINEVAGGPPVVLRQAVIPAYVQRYLRRNMYLLLVCELLGVLGLIAYLVHPLFPRQDFIWMQVGLLITLPAAFLWHAARMRQRLMAWSDLWFGLFLTLALIMVSMYPAIWFLQTMEAHSSVWLILAIIIVSPIILLIFARRININTVRWLIGTETYDYQNKSIDDYLQSRYYADRTYRQHVRALKLYGWCPAYQPSGKLRLAAREESAFATIFDNPARLADERRGVLIVHHPSDLFFARYVAAHLSDLEDQIHVIGLPYGLERGTLSELRPRHLIFVLSRYSTWYAGQLVQEKELWFQTDILIISLEKLHQIPPDLRQLQWIDATTWNFSEVGAAARRAIRDEPIAFSGAKDARSNLFGLPTMRLLWLAYLLFLPLLGVYDSLRLDAYALMSPWLFYLASAAILWQATNRRYSLQLSGWTLLLAITLLWAQYSAAGVWEDRGNTVLAAVALVYTCTLFLRSSKLREKQIARAAAQQGEKLNEYSFTSFLCWGPDKTFEWSLFIPALLAWAVSLSVAVLLGS